MTGLRWIALAIVTTSATASAQPKAPKLPRVADVAKLTILQEEGGPSRQLCKAFARRIVIDLVRKRWTEETCFDDGNRDDTPTRAKDSGRIRSYDDVVKLYGQLVVENSDGGCAKDAGGISLIVTRKNGATARYFGAPLACPRRTGWTIPTLQDDIGTFTTYLSSVD